jgi:hypothetical protein
VVPETRNQLIQRITPHQLQHVALRRKMEDALSGKFPHPTFAQKKVLEPVAFTATTTRTPAIKPLSALEAEKSSIVTTYWAFPQKFAATAFTAELFPILEEEGFQNPPRDDGAAWCWQ